MSLRGTIEAMVGTLSKSVADINSAGGDAALLTKTFTEFTDGLSGLVDADLAKRAPVEEPLYKGLGTVGRVANLLGCVAERVEAIRAGYDNKWQMPSENGPSNKIEPSDVPSADVADLLTNVVHMAELALRAAVNEHVTLADDDEVEKGAPAGFELIQVPDGDDPNTYAVLKTALPEPLAKYATDPNVLQDAIIENGLATMMAAGVPEEALSKLFDEGGEALAKKFPPKKNPDGSDAGDGATGGDGTGSDAAMQATPPGTDGTTAGAGGAGDATDGTTDPNSDGTDPNGDDPLSIALRIWAALGVQLNHISDLVNGGDTTSDGTGQSADPGTDLGQGGDAVTKSATGGRTLDLAKRHVAAPDAATTNPALEELAKRFDALAADSEKKSAVIDELAKGIELLLAQPQAPKGAVRAVPAPNKQNDAGTLQKSADQIIAEEKERLEKMAPEDRAMELIKISQRNPEPNPRNR